MSRPAEPGAPVPPPSAIRRLWSVIVSRRLIQLRYGDDGFAALGVQFPQEDAAGLTTAFYCQPHVQSRSVVTILCSLGVPDALLDVEQAIQLAALNFA